MEKQLIIKKRSEKRKLNLDTAKNKTTKKLDLMMQEYQIHKTASTSFGLIAITYLGLIVFTIFAIDMHWYFRKKRSL